MAQIDTTSSVPDHKAEGAEKRPYALWDISIETLKIFVPLTILLTSGIMGFLYFDREIKLSALETSENSLVELGRSNVNRDFEVFISDVSILAKSESLERLINEDTYGARTTLANKFLIFAEDRRNYDQIRYLDKSGMEIVRVNYANGKAAIVRQDELQDKSGRYYFSETFALARGEVFISPLDLNIERGQIEIPFKPIIRVGTPIYDLIGRKQGIVVLSYLGERLIGRFDEAMSATSGHAYLINNEGYITRGQNPDEEWGFMFDNDFVFDRKYPNSWSIITGSESGRFYDKNGFFTFSTFHPNPKNRNQGADEPTRSWKIVTHIPTENYAFASLKRLKPTLAFFGVLLFFSGLGSYGLGISRLNKRLAGEALRRSEQWFSKAFHFSPNMIVIADISDGRIHDVNETWLSILGYERGEVIGKTVFELGLWSEPRQRLKLVKKIMREGNVRDFVGELITKDGGTLSFLFSGETIE
ncbi:MAG: PAS domain S-box protein, partial [Rhodospirillales bacterium]